MTHTYTPILLLLLLLVGLSPVVSAETVAPNQRRHIRTNDPRLMRLVHEGFRASATFRRLVERLQQSDVVVYLDTGGLGSSDGRLMFLSAVAGLRYVHIRVVRLASTAGQIALIGHELQHAVEIAEAPDVVDSSSLARAYQRIGYVNPRAIGGLAFDSDAAVEVGHRVLRELSDKDAPARDPLEMPVLNSTY
jgi:hypothetical protein